MDVQKMLDKWIKTQEDLVDQLEQVRQAEVSAFLGNKKAETDLSRITREKIIEITSNKEFSGSIPGAPKAWSNEWDKWFIDRMLERDSDFIEALAKLDQAQEAYLYARAATENVRERLQAVNIRLQAVMNAYD